MHKTQKRINRKCLFRMPQSAALVLTIAAWASPLSVSAATTPATSSADSVSTVTITCRNISSPEAVQPREDSSPWSIKTSVPALAAAVYNLAGEFNFAPCWSVALELKFSAWDYGKSTRKFRIFELRPEVRFWPLKPACGFFVEAHAAMISYNVALPSWEFRIQDRNGIHPALGGGLGIGYRLPIGHSGRWSAEAALGVGAYALDYERYENRTNGPPVDSRKRFFFGVDNVAISIVYNFKSIQ